MKLRYTRPALAELSAILDYISIDAPLAADRVHARIRSVIDILLVYPSIGVRTDELGIRRLTVTPYPYLVFYEQSGDEIIIHSIRHGARVLR